MSNIYIGTICLLLMVYRLGDFMERATTSSFEETTEGIEQGSLI